MAIDRVNHDAALAVVDDSWGSERGGRRVPFVPVGTGSLLEIQSFQLVSGLHSELSEVQLASVVIYFSQITEPDLGCVLYGQNRALFTMRRVT